jgi:hypothetical protein
VFNITERDSPRDQLVVTLFLLTVFGLLLGAGVRNRMMKAGLDTNIPWNASRRWWEVSDPNNLTSFYVDNYPKAWAPRRQMEEFGLSRFGHNAAYAERDVGMGDYIPVSESLGAA